MKKLKDILLVVLFLLTYSYVGATEKDGEGVSLNGEQTLLVDLSNVNQGTLILFEDQFGVALFRDNLLKSGKYNKSLDLEMVPQGIYFLKVDKRFATKTWKIQKSSSGLEIIGNSSTISKPHFRVQKDIVSVYASNLEKKRMDLIVEDSHGEILTTLKASDKNFQKSLDFSTVPPGEYFVTLYKGNEKFTEMVVIN